MDKSKYFYMKIFGDYAMFTSPSSKASGDRYSYSVPTKEALRGIIDNCYFKPSFKNVVDEVRIINKISTESMGARTLLSNGKNDLNQYTYLRDVEYLVKFHFEWNLDRPDLENDRNKKKHEDIMQRSIKKGGRRDVFLGTRECFGFLEEIDENYYNTAVSYYDNQNISFGIMFNSFIYPVEPSGKLVACYTETLMEDSVIHFKDSSDCEIQSELNTYKFKYPEKIKAVDEEYIEYQSFEDTLWIL